MKDKTLAELEREMDEATLKFWEAWERNTEAKTKLVLSQGDYYTAEREMTRAKATYLRAKLAKER